MSKEKTRPRQEQARRPGIVSGQTLHPNGRTVVNG